MLKLVSSPDFIRRVYHFQYNACDTKSDLRWDWFWVWNQDYVKTGLNIFASKCEHLLV